MRPLLTMASAAVLTRSSETAPAKQFQLFHPIGGLSAIVSPTTILNFRLAAPREFFARKVTRYSPLLSSVPVIRPVCGLSCKPAGKLSAAKVIGRSPVAATVNKNGEPGRTPKIAAPLMRGFGEAGGVKITAGSAGAAMASGCAYPAV